MSRAQAVVGLDTSFVLRLLVGQPEEQAVLAVEQLDRMRAEGKAGAVSDLVVAETYFALQFHYEVPKQRALDVLRAFLESPEILPLGESLQVLQQGQLGRSKPGFVDRVIHAGYLRHTTGMLSFEKAAAKLPGVHVPN